MKIAVRYFKFALPLLCGMILSVAIRSSPLSKGVRHSLIGIASSDTIRIIVSKGWNLISLPLNVSDGRVSTLFPTAISRAFAYQGSYVQRDTLQPGMGYWLKFAAPEIISVVGEAITSRSLKVKRGWNMIGGPWGNINVNELRFDSCNAQIVSKYYAYDPGIGYLTSDTLEAGKGYWVKVNRVSFEQKWIKVASIREATVTVHPTEPNILYAGTPSDFSAGQNGAILKSTDWGATWDTLVRDVDVNGIILDPTNPNVGYADLGGVSGSIPGILKTTDAGATWFHADSGIYLFNDFSAAGVVLIDPNNSDVLYGGAGGADQSTRMYKSTNGGRYWTPLDIFHAAACTLTATLESNDIKLAIDPQNTNVLYAGTWLDYKDTVLYRSTDAGATWNILHCFPQGTGPINWIQVHGLDSNTIFLHLASRLLRSTDQGQTWHTIDDSLPGTSYGVVEAKKNPDRLYAIRYQGGQTTGVFRSTDRGSSWSHLITDTTYITHFQYLDETAGYMYIRESTYPPAPDIEGIYRLKICR